MPKTPARSLISRTGLALSLVALFGASCSSTASSVEDDSPWLQPSPTLRQQIEDEARRLPWTHGLERLELIQWFAAVGEPGYPTLLAMVEDPRPDVAGSALAAIGATRDTRLVEPLHALPWPAERAGSDLDLERARTLLRLGDWRAVPALVQGLRDERMVVRALCIQALEESTHERFEYDPRGAAEAREASVVKWEAWVNDRLIDPLLAAKSVEQPKSVAEGD